MKMYPGTQHTQHTAQAGLVCPDQTLFKHRHIKGA